MARLVRMVGRRGAFLLFLALLDVLYGYSIAVSPAPQEQAYSLILPARVWAVAWIAAGVVCAASAPARRDWPGYTAAAVIKMSWAALWARLWIVGGFPRGWVSLVVWAAFAGVVVMVAGWPEQPGGRH